MRLLKGFWHIQEISKFVFLPLRWLSHDNMRLPSTWFIVDLQQKQLFFVRSRNQQAETTRDQIITNLADHFFLGHKKVFNHQVHCNISVYSLHE